MEVQKLTLYPVIILYNDEVQKTSYVLLCGLNIYSDYVIAIYIHVVNLNFLCVVVVCVLFRIKLTWILVTLLPILASLFLTSLYSNSVTFS